MTKINTIVYTGTDGFESVQYTYKNACCTVEELRNGYFDFVKLNKSNHVVDDKYVYLLDSLQPREELSFSQIGEVLFIKNDRWVVEFIDWRYIHNYNMMESNSSVIKFFDSVFKEKTESNIKFNILGTDLYKTLIVINPHYCIADGRGGGGNPLLETVLTIFIDPENVLRMISYLGNAFDSIVIEFFKVTLNIMENHSEWYKELNPFTLYLFEHIKEDLYDLPYEVIKDGMIATFTTKATKAYIENNAKNK